MTKNNRYSILYVDDEEINLRILKSIFRRDFDVVTANSGQRALEILSTEKVDFIITDQKMPNMTGVEFLKNVKSEFPELNLPTIMLSGYAQPNDIKGAFSKSNLFKFVSKPFDTLELKSLIKSAVSKT